MLQFELYCWKWDLSENRIVLSSCTDVEDIYLIHCSLHCAFTWLSRGFCCAIFFHCNQTYEEFISLYVDFVIFLNRSDRWFIESWWANNVIPLSSEVLLMILNNYVMHMPIWKSKILEIYLLFSLRMSNYMHLCKRLNIMSAFSLQHAL